VINTTGLLICDPRDLLPCRHSMKINAQSAAPGNRRQSQVLSFQAM
jgi:hypothetical protein